MDVTSVNQLNGIGQQTAVSSYASQQSGTTPTQTSALEEFASRAPLNQIQDSVELSSAAQQQTKTKSADQTPTQAGTSADETGTTDAAKSTDSSQTSAKPGELTDEQKQELSKLKSSDREVKAHEQAHKSVGGQYTRGAIQLQYQRGPDGQLYAVAGEVSIDLSEVSGDPEATIRKMEQVRRAALAPSNPSPQDRQVAAEAAQKAAQARLELLREQNASSAYGSNTDLSTTPLEQFQAEPADGQFLATNPFSAFYERNATAFQTPGSFFELVA